MNTARYERESRLITQPFGIFPASMLYGLRYVAGFVDSETHVRRKSMFAAQTSSKLRLQKTWESTGTLSYIHVFIFTEVDTFLQQHLQKYVRWSFVVFLLRARQLFVVSLNLLLNRSDVRVLKADS